MLDTRTAQTTLENGIRDTILYALGKRLPAVASVAELRQIITRGESGTPTRNPDDLAVVVVSGITVAAYRWSPWSATADNGTSVIAPNDAPIVPGRWIQWTSQLRFSPVVGGPASYLHLLQSGPLQRVIVLDRSMEEDEIGSMISGQVPAVVIEASGDSPEDMTLSTGYRYSTGYDFKVSVIAQNLRDYREHAHDSAFTPDAPSVLGANTIDGFIKALLGGTHLSALIDGIRNVKIGHGENWFSEFGQRRVIRSHSFLFQVTEVNPAAPGDFGPAEELRLQSELTDLHDQPPPFTLDTYLISGATVPVGPGLVKPVLAGSAVLAQLPVAYAGQLFTFLAYADTYRDLLPSGAMVFLPVATESEAPALTPTAVRVGMTRTDGSGTIGDRLIIATREPYGNPFVVPLS